MNRNRLEIHLQKKGFKKTDFFSNDDNRYFTKIKQDTSGNIIRRFQVIPSQNNFDLVYETTSGEEYASLKNEIKSSGFKYSDADSTQPLLFQKKQFSIQCSSRSIDSFIFYRIHIAKKNIPKLKDLVFAEDLLQLEAQEYLAEAFGRQNIKSDTFFLSAAEGKKCTIIFPNTSRQAIFLWKDQNNLKDISFIIIGEQIHTTQENANPTLLSDWRSNQGIYCGMSLGEIQKINKAPINFYNWRNEAAGFLAPKNKGEIDFEKLKPVFNCMNCGFLYIKNADIIQSSDALEENQKVYVGSFVVVPEKKNDLTSQPAYK